MKRTVLRHIVKLLKTKDENILKVARGKKLHNRTIQNIPDFFSKAMEFRTMNDSRHWNVINMLKEKELSAGIFYQVKISFKNILKTFSGKRKTEFVASRPLLENVLKEILQSEEK